MKLGKSFSRINQILPEIESNKIIKLENGDVFIHSPGFEDRTLAFKSAIIAAEGVRGILCDFRPYNKNNKFNEVRESLIALGISVSNEDIIEYNRFGPNDFESRLHQRLIERSTQRVIIDISTMSKLQIMLVLNCCKKEEFKLKILYCEAKSYKPAKEEFEASKQKKKVHQPSLQIFTGVHGVIRVKSLSSVSMQGQPSAAILFMSFNDILTQVFLNSVYPGRLFLINGKPPVHKWREEATAWIHDRVRREWIEDNPLEWNKELSMHLPKRSVSTLYYKETVELLLNLYWKLSTENRILLAPSGSKMQTVGCFLVKALHPDIHIEYSAPEGFVKGYSSGIGPSWYLDLGCLKELLLRIENEERKEFLEIVTQNNDQ